MAVSFDRARLAPLKNTVAVVGVGETDYGSDYRGAGGKAVAKGEARVRFVHLGIAGVETGSRRRRSE